MKRRKRELKRLLGSSYSYKRYMSDRELKQFKNQMPKYFAENVVASLIAGCVKIEVVLFRGSCGLVLGYDVFVKDGVDSPEWIFFDSPMDEVILKETELLAVLDRVVADNHLSYTECCFDSIDGKVGIASKQKPSNK